jgi:group I intron endonuclease
MPAMNIYSIYKATCIITNECYIGFDSHWPKRKIGHKHQSKKQNNIKFYNAIRKYGWDNFVWEVIYQSKDKKHCLDVMEPHFIKEHDSMLNGLNTSPGGNRGPILFGESNGMFGKTHSERVKKDGSERARKTFTGKSYEELYGTEKSNILKKIRSEKAKGKNNSVKNNPRFDFKEYTFFNIETKEKTTSTRYDFYTKYGINKGGVSDMVNKGITYKKWCVV